MDMLQSQCATETARTILSWAKPAASARQLDSAASDPRWLQNLYHANTYDYSSSAEGQSHSQLSPQNRISATRAWHEFWFSPRAAWQHRSYMAPLLPHCRQ